MKRAAFALVAVLAVTVVAANSSLSQSVELPVKEQSQTRRLREQYIFIAAWRAKRMTDAELKEAIQELKGLPESTLALQPAVEQLERVAEQYPDSLAAQKARMATYLLCLQDVEAVNRVGDILKQEFARQAGIDAGAVEFDR